MTLHDNQLCISGLNDEIASIFMAKLGEGMRADRHDQHIIVTLHGKTRDEVMPNIGFLIAAAYRELNTACELACCEQV